MKTYFFLMLLPVISAAGNRNASDPDSSSGLDYGEAAYQNSVLNIGCLHARGFTGKGITIAHFDDGFDGVDTLPAFRHLFEGGRYKGGYDFVFGRELCFDSTGTHGAHTFSTLAAYLPGVLIGTAFDANVALAHTEDSRSETHAEEHNWMQAMEWAGSLGVHIITSSLGYTEFDSLEGHYTYADLNGDKAIVTLAADMAAARGILVVVPAGNSGQREWRYLNAPGDADSALTVGAVDSSGRHAAFSSYGPTADGRVKPDVAAMGHRVKYIHSSGKILTGSGTSFSTPMMAGLAACLMQAHPERSNMEIISAIRQSAGNYGRPDYRTGYGIPDACRADSILSVMDNLASGRITMSSNPLGVWYEIDPCNASLCLRRKGAVKGRNRVQTVAVTDLVEKQIFDISKPRIRKKKPLTLPALTDKGHYLVKITTRSGSHYTINYRML